MAIVCVLANVTVLHDLCSPTSVKPDPGLVETAQHAVPSALNLIMSTLPELFPVK